MKQILRALTPLLIPISLGVSSSNAFASSKVTICHIPPGNPENAHTITVSESAVAAHTAHGDSLGGCDSGGSSSTAHSASASYVICDDRVGETGRRVSVSLLGRLSTERVKCD